MATYEFRLVGTDTALGTKELETAPRIDDDVTLEGIIYRVDTEPENSRKEPIVVYVRKAAGI
jgi:hypothetical protein